MTVDVVEPLVPGREYRLFAAITEDDIYAAGSNGEVWHHQVFRHLYPDVAGLPLATALGPQVLEIEAPLDPTWVYANLRLVVYAMDVTTHRVLNAADGRPCPSAGTPVADGRAAGDAPARRHAQSLQPADDDHLHRRPGPARCGSRSMTCAGARSSSCCTTPSSAGTHAVRWPVSTVPAATSRRACTSCGSRPTGSPAHAEAGPVAMTEQGPAWSGMTIDRANVPDIR